MTTTNQLLDELNKLKGLEYPQVGFLYFANLKVYRIANSNGGLNLSHLNGTPQQRRDKIRDAIAELKPKHY